MKTLQQYITERLVLSKNKKSTYKLFPKTREELKEMIESEIEKNGNECSLNHIDVSKIIDMCKLFFGSLFNGDISEWDVSNVTDMSSMFMDSNFTGENGDISKWDVSNVKDMWGMFERSNFKSDISDWDVSGLKLINSNIFLDCPLQNNPPKWYRK